MKLRVIVFSLILAANGLCSWPDDTLSAAVIASNTKEKLSQFLEKADEFYATASDYRGLTLKLNRKTNQWDCSVPVGYYEVHSWLSDSWVDTEKAGWTRRPSRLPQALRT